MSQQSDLVCRQTRWPIIRLAHSDDEHMIVPQQFNFQLGERAVAQRTQLPLDLAWAMSVHKAQGATVRQAVVDVRNAFEVGQVYGESQHISIQRE